MANSRSTTRPYALYLVLAVALACVVLRLDTVPLLFFAAVGLFAVGAGLIDAGNHKTNN